MYCPLCQSCLSGDRPRYCITLREVKAERVSVLDGRVAVREYVCEECWQDLLSACAGPVRAASAGGVAHDGGGEEPEPAE